MLRLMKHILEKKVLFNGVIVRTFWMTLVQIKSVFNVVLVGFPLIYSFVFSLADNLTLCTYFPAVNRNINIIGHLEKLATQFISF